MQTEILGSRERQASGLSARSETLRGAVLAVLLGGFLIWGVGFSHSSVLHNAAHDVRHSAAFPCH